jgi:hypothetical protein
VDCNINVAAPVVFDAIRGNCDVTLTAQKGRHESFDRYHDLVSATLISKSTFPVPTRGATGHGEESVALM